MRGIVSALSPRGPVVFVLGVIVLGAAVLGGGGSAAHPAATPPPFVVAFTPPVDEAVSYPRAPLFAMRADGTDVRQLTSGEAFDLPGEWSPAGDRLLFERIEPTRVYSGVWVANLDGSPATMLDGGYAEIPRWSADGGWIAYQNQTDYGSGGGRADTTFDLFAVRPDGSASRALGSGGTSGSSSDWVGEGAGWEWSPDSRRIAFVQPDSTRPPDPSSGDPPYRIVIVDATAGRISGRVQLPSNLSSNPNLVDEFAQSYVGWAWSADGRRLAFVRDGRASGPATKRGLGLSVLDPANGKVRSVTPLLSRRVVAFRRYRSSLADYGVGWDWSPDGRRVAFVQPDGSHPGRTGGQLPLRLAVADLATGRVWRLPGSLSTSRLNGSSLATDGTGWVWSPDGKRIALVRPASASGRLTISVADVARRTVRVVGPGTEGAWAPDGTRLAITDGSAKERCGGIWTIDVATARRSQLVRRVRGTCDTNVQWSPDASFLMFTRVSSGSELRFTVAPDGSPLRSLTEALASDVQWPDDCRQIPRYGGWVLLDAAGIPRLVVPPRVADSSYQAWRC